MNPRDKAAREIFAKDRGFYPSDFHCEDKQYSRELRLISEGWNARDAEVAKLWEMLERAKDFVRELRMTKPPRTFGDDVENIWLCDYDKLKVEK